jgi:hypothetical protein
VLSCSNTKTSLPTAAAGSLWPTCSQPAHGRGWMPKVCLNVHLTRLWPCFFAFGC